MDRWVGKVALVTGASAGIGAAIVEELAKHGMKVVGLARRAEKVEDIKKRVGKVKGEIHALKGDVSKEEDIVAAFKWIKDKFGAIHVLVNNAGVLRTSSIIEAKTQYFREILDINVLGLVICTQEALKLMKATGVDDGHIVHINSIAGHHVPNTGVPGLNLYPASKHAVTGFTETLRQELNHTKSRTRVTSISPGYVDTEIGDASAKATGNNFLVDVKKSLASLPALESQDIADVVVFVLGMPARAQVHEVIIRPVGEGVLNLDS